MTNGVDLMSPTHQVGGYNLPSYLDIQVIGREVKPRACKDQINSVFLRV
jgi:hypothetical protein